MQHSFQLDADSVAQKARGARAIIEKFLSCIEQFLVSGQNRNNE
jgi:hypothetical protein